MQFIIVVDRSFIFISYILYILPHINKLLFHTQKPRALLQLSLNKIQKTKRNRDHSQRYYFPLEIIFRNKSYHNLPQTP